VVEKKEGGREWRAGWKEGWEREGSGVGLPRLSRAPRMTPLIDLNKQQ